MFGFLGAIFGFIFSVIVFCVFVGMFLRLGRIEKILSKMAVHQGAIERERPATASLLDIDKP